MSIDTAPATLRDLEGRVALAVGGVRDVGAAIAEYIAAHGVPAVFGYPRSDEEPGGGWPRWC